jgi:Ran GTPase-activating protein (RanGAP) involved in mRNA processing and transport
MGIKSQQALNWTADDIGSGMMSRTEENERGERETEERTDEEEEEEDEEKEEVEEENCFTPPSPD